MRIDTDDLIDSNEVARLLGLSTSRAVSTYRNRYADSAAPFPVPVLEKGSGKCVLWRRQDVEAWATATGRSRL